jgi:hypothetical protein
MSDSRPRVSIGRIFRTLVLLALIAATSIAVTWGFLQGRGERALEAERDAPIKAPLRVAIVDGEPTITLDDVARRSSGIVTAELRRAAQKPELQAYGTVLDLQPLTELSNSYTTTKAQLLTAQAKLNASRMAFERAQRLYQDQQNVSAAQVQAAESAFRVDEASVAAAQAQLENVASSAIQQWGPALGRAVVDRSPILLRLLQRQDVLVQVTLPPGEALADPPRTAIAQAGGAIRANLEYLSSAPRTDARIQGISFLYIAPASSGLLPGMNIAVTLATGKAAGGTLIPASAIVWSDGKAWAYFRTGEQAFARREIATDTPAPDGGYIVKELPENSQVVAQGGQLLLSEEFRSRIQVGEDAGQ